VDGILSAIARRAKEFAMLGGAAICFWQLTLPRLSHTIPHVILFNFLVIAGESALHQRYKPSAATSPAE
jgi:hypothetical protein